ncbi:cation diffusion facilitator family transporter [Granulosicoccaceae sp. 1_MG-2023]|nr:cation diffusion facilitator family transporter [Granulosicoccaceae sp. 1_MG-2023]
MPGHASHHHAHDHSHSHLSPLRGASPEQLAKRRRALGIAVWLTGGFMLAEIAGGLISGSLALLADAGHMLTDTASLLLARIAIGLAARPADPRRTYGFDRISVLAAFVNGLALFVIAAWIVVEAWHRLSEPAPVTGGLMFWVAVGGLVVNIISFKVLSAAGGENLNVRAAALHVLGDLLGSLAAIIAAIIIMLSGWTPIDPLLSVLVALLILRSAYAVVRESANILLEGAPPHVDGDGIAADLESQVAGVLSARHVHVWMISEERPMATLEVSVKPASDRDAILQAVKQRLREHWSIDHATVEVSAAQESA